MAAYTSANFQNLMKEVYDDGDIRSLLADNFELLKMIGSFDGPITPGGKYWLFALMSQWPTSVGAMSFSGTTRTPQVGTWVNGKVYARQRAATYALEYAGLQLSKSNKQAFISTSEAAKEALVLRIRDHEVKQFLGGNAGTIAVCNGNYGPGTTLPVHGMLGYTDGAGNYLTQGAEVFQPGDQIAVDPANLGGGGVQYRTVVSVNESAGTIELNSNVTVTDGWPICYGESGTNMDYQNSMDGLYDLYNASVAYETLDPATTPKWTPHVFTGAVAGTDEPLSSKHINRMLTTPKTKSGANIDVILQHSNMVQSYMDLFENQIQFEPGNFKGGMSKATWNLMGQDVKFMFDPQVPHNTLFGIPTEDCLKFVLQEGKWMDEDGSQFKWISNTTQLIAVWVSLKNIGTRNRNRFAIQKDIEEAF